MKSAESGNTVRVHYTGTLNDGDVFDSSVDRDPLEFRIGDGQMIPGFEKAVTGMNVGDTKTVKIPASEAYGARREDLVVKLTRSHFPDNIVPVTGLQLSLKSPEGQIINAIITSVEEENVFLDANHPLAGKDLTFEIELMEIF
ncbi:MAG: peptidylprolyl isomerase [Nitrospiraceae bacterium]|nr:MAG: peptidylprolyl isomerase [Nitrospiraceae bacterium]